MRFETNTVDAYPHIIEQLASLEDQDSRIGGTKEMMTVTVHSQNPRRRWLTRPNINWAFGLQESFAYWNGLNPGHVERYNSQMENYMTDGELQGSAYGRYLRNIPHDQIQRALDMLDENPETRRAVMNIHNAFIEDYDGPDVACTIYLQPFIRDGELHMIANLRSQDMLWGYPYDTQAFQWVQEVMAGILEVDVGEYWHIMNSCHYYTEFEEQVLESAEGVNGHEADDCRLTLDGVKATMLSMRQGLRRSRDGKVPHEEIEFLQRYSQYYADWMRTMAAYEQHRFHGDDVAAATLASDVETLPMKEWISSTVTLEVERPQQ